MAVEENIIDPTQVGTSGLRGLQGVDKAPVISPERMNFINSLPKSIQHSFTNPVRDSDDMVAASNRLTMTTPTVDYIGNDQVGQSRYDDQMDSAYQFNNLAQSRAELQPWYDQLGAGILKGTVLAGTTFADGVAGSLVGVLNMLGTAADGGNATEVTSAFWNNPFSNAMQSVNEWSESAIPNYYTQAEQEEPWYENIFTSNFLGDKFLKNLGFAVGAAYSGKVGAQGMSKVLGMNSARKAFAGAVMDASGNTIKDANAAYKAYLSGDALVDGVKLEAQLASNAAKLKAAEPILKVTGATTSAFGEARIEAINNSKDWYELQKTRLDDSMVLVQDNLRSQMLSEGNPEYFTTVPSGPEGKGISIVLSPQGEAELAQRVKTKYEDGLAKLNQDRLKLGNADFALNIPLLAGSNWVQFGRMYAGGYNTAKSVANNIKGSIEKGFEYSRPSKFARAAKIASKVISEGPVEEMGQSAISKAAGYKYSSELNDFFGAKIDPDAEEETVGWLNAMAQGLSETYGSVEGWEEGFIGGLIGLVGVPGFRGLKKESGGMQSPIYVQGGIWEDIWEDIGEIRRQDEESNGLVNQLNSRVKDPEFMNYYQGMIRHNKYQNDMEKAAQESNEFDYKNAEHSQMISDIVMFEKAGRMQDLYDIIDQAGTVKPEDVPQLRQLTTNTEIDTSPYQNRTDQEVMEHVQKQASDYKDSVDRYRKISNDIKVKMGDNFQEDELEELTWMVTKIDNWEKRFADTHESAKESLKAYGNKLGTVTKDGVNTEFSDIINANPIQLLTTLTSEEIASKLSALSATSTQAAVDAILGSLEVSLQQEAVDNKKDGRGKKQMFNKLNRLKTKLENDIELSSKYPQLASQIEDLSKLAVARTGFIQKYHGYVNNPQALRTHMNSEKTKVEDTINSTDINEIKDKASAAKTFDEFRSAISSNPNISLQTKAINELADSNNEFAKQLKDINSYATDFYNRLSLSPLGEEQKKRVKTLFDNAYRNAKSLSDVSNTSNPLLLDNTLFEQEELSPEDFQETIFHLQNLMKNVNDGIEFKSKLSTKIAPTKTKKTTPTTIIPKANSIGGISGTELKEENNELNKSLEKGESGVKKNYWKPAISQMDLANMSNGVFIPLNQANPNYDILYKYLESNGAFEYVNRGNVKAGDSIGFMIDPKLNQQAPFLNNTILLVHDKQIVGVLDETNAGNFQGLKELRQRVKEGYDKRGDDSYRFSLEQVGETFKIKDNSSDIYLAETYPDVATAEKALADKKKNNHTTEKYIHTEYTAVNQVIPGRVPMGSKERSLSEIEGASEGIFGIMKSGQISVPNYVADVIQPKDRNNKEGRLYLMVKAADGKFYPTAVRVKKYNPVDFDISNESVRNTARYKNIQKAIEILASSTNNAEVFEAKQLLENELYLGDNIHLDYFSNGSSEGLRIKDTRSGIEQVKWVQFKDVQQASIGSIGDGGFIAAESAEAIVTEKSKDTIISDITQALYSLNLGMQVKLSELNKGAYNESLINDNLLTSNIEKASVVSAWFVANPLTINGKQIQAEVPPAAKPTPTNKVQTVVGGKESVMPTVSVTYNGTVIYIDANGDIYEEDSRVKSMPSDQMREKLMDLAWIKRGEQGLLGLTKAEFQDKYRQVKDGTFYYNLPSGKVMNLSTVDYADIPKKQKPVVVNTTEAKIIANQQLIAERPNEANGNNYMIQESDGVYPYQRVTNVIGSNWTGPEYKGKATNNGSKVEAIIRDFFQDKVPTRPEGMMSEPFDKLLNRLNDIKTQLDERGERFLTNNIVLFSKFQNGNDFIRVAGEVDILAVDKDGNYKIYDVKTSKHSFKGKTFIKGGGFYSRSPLQQYTLQLSGYKNLFESQYGVPITQMALLPFVLQYDTETISDIIPQKGIPIKYNSEVEKYIPLGTKAVQEQSGSTPSSIVESSPTSKASAATSRLNRFKGVNKNTNTDQNNSQKLQDNSNNLLTFTSLNPQIQKSLQAKGFTEQSFNVLTKDEKDHEIECVK